MDVTNQIFGWKQFLIKCFKIPDDSGYEKKKKKKQCGNTDEQILLNEPRKQWIAGSHIYKTIFV